MDGFFPENLEFTPGETINSIVYMCGFVNFIEDVGNPQKASPEFYLEKKVSRQLILC